MQNLCGIPRHKVISLTFLGSYISTETSPKRADGCVAVASDVTVGVVVDVDCNYNDNDDTGLRLVKISDATLADVLLVATGTWMDDTN